MERHSQNALRIAQFLEAHPRVERVLYPGLPYDPGHAIASKQMRLDGLKPAFGGMISFIYRGGLAQARQIAARTHIFTLAESLGGVESLIEHPAAMTHASVAGSALEVPGGLIRLSVGVEHVEDLLQDLDCALSVCE
jgi:cystathionine gamma-synthase